MADLSVNIGELQMKNPVMTASGTFGYGEEFSLEKNISGMRLKARATGNLSTTNLKLDSQLKQQAEYQKPGTSGGGSDPDDNPDPKPDGGGEAPDPAA